MVGDVLSRIWNCLMEVPPVAVIDPDQGGVLLRMGRLKRTLGPGWYWKVPFVDKVRKVTVSEQTIDMPNQTVGTLDGRMVTASGYIRYRIVDPAKAILGLYDYDMSLMREAMKEIASVIASRASTTQQEVEAAVNEVLEGFTAHGIDVMDFGLTDYAVTRAIRLIQ